MKRILIIFILSVMTGATELFSNDITTIKDSLLSILDTLPPGSKRMDILVKLTNLAPMSPASLQYTEQILKEAGEQGNKELECFAIYAHVIYYFNHQDEANTTLWMKKLEKPALEGKFYNYYFQGKRAEITMHIIARKIEYSITEAEKMYESAQKLDDALGMSSAKLCLMTAYLVTMRNKEGLEAAMDAYRLLPPTASLKTRKDILQEIVLACSSTQDKSLMKFLDEYKNVLDKLYSSKESQLFKNNAYLLLESLYALYYLNENKMDQATSHLKEMDKYYFDECYIPCRGLYYDAYAHYYKSIREYDKAIACADSAISLLANLSENGGLNYEVNRAKILVEAGRLDEAIPYFQQLLKKKESFYRELSSSQMNEIYEMNSIDKLILEKEQHKAIVHYIIITVIAIAVLVLLSFTIRYYLVRKRLRKEEKESREMSLIAEEANEVKSRFLANMSYNIRIPLNNVLGFSQLMTTDVESIDTDQWKAYTEIIQTNSAELIQLVNDVLDLSRLEAGKTKWQMGECEIVQLCSDITGMVHMRCGDRIHVDFHTDIDQLTVQADSARFMQVILSTLIYADPCEDKREVSFYLNNDTEERVLVFRILNSPLADAQLQTQKTEIRHNINRMTIEYFGGCYTVKPDAAEGATIRFTYPYTE